MKKLYAAYGSNMDEDQMAYRCPGAVLYGKGVIYNYHLLFKGSQTGSYATIEREAPTTEGVPVLLWLITDDDEQRLDHYEGYPRFYYKKGVTVEHVQKYAGWVFIETGVDGVGKWEAPTWHHVPDQEAMVYIMDEKRLLGTPAKHYLDPIRRAYKRYGLDRMVLEEARTYSHQNKGKVR